VSVKDVAAEAMCDSQPQVLFAQSQPPIVITIFLAMLRVNIAWY